MAPRRAAAAAAAVVEEEEEEESLSGLPTLQFNQPLSWRAGKAIQISDLLKRLQALSKELRDYEQEEVDRDSITGVAKELCGQNLIAHRDKGVRAWTACCLVDVLRLCAPDAPYTGAQLRDIFTLLVNSILPSLADPTSAYHQQHLFVLQSLAQVKSVILLADIPNADPLILQLFATFFDSLSASPKEEQLGKTVENNMTAILTILVDEAQSLPQEVVDMIVAQFLRADPRTIKDGSKKEKAKKPGAEATDDRQMTLRLRELPPAYGMAKNICNSCPEKMSRYVSQYFSDVIMDASASDRAANHRNKGDDSDVEDLPNGPSEEDMQDLAKAHRLLRELWRASPSVLQNVVPQLEAELSAENIRLRLMATETMGDMISGIGTGGPPPPPKMDPALYPPLTLSAYSDEQPPLDILVMPSSPQPFSQTHPAAYASFLSRKNDKSPIIRSAWTACIGRIITTSAGGVGLSATEETLLLQNLADKLVDADEKVRIAAISALNEFSLRDIVLKLGLLGGVDKQGSVLSNLADRCRDKKHNVRVDGMKALGRMWGVGYGELLAGNDNVTSLLGSIPSKVFDAYFTNDPNIHLLIDHVLFELFLPLPFPPIKAKKGAGEASKEKQRETAEADKIRTERILLLLKSLDERSRKAFHALEARQKAISKVLESFVKRCEAYNGGTVEENEAGLKASLGQLIDWFAKQLPEPTKVSADLWKFAKTNQRRTYRLIEFCTSPDSDYKTVRNAIREIMKKFEEAAMPSHVLETLVPLLYRSSLIICNKSHVPAIVEFSRTDEKGLGNAAHELLKEISTHAPAVLKAHVKELCQIIEDQAPSASKPNDTGMVDHLRACAGFARKFPGDMPTSHKFLDSLSAFALHATPPAASKHAVTILLTASEKKRLHARDLVKKCLKGFKYDGDNFLSRLAAISQLVLLAHDQAEPEADAIFDIAIKEILLQVRHPAQDEEPEWVSDNNVDDEIIAKQLALKILVNRLRSCPDPTTAKSLAPPVIKLLTRLISDNGELSSNSSTPKYHRSRLRLLAAQLFLKLSKISFAAPKPTTSTTPTTPSATHIRVYDDLLTPAIFNRLALIALDATFEVRQRFVSSLQKNLSQSRLPPRFYTIPFLLAFEPEAALKRETSTWIAARARNFAQQRGNNHTLMEATFARLLSVLAHHPDFQGAETDDIVDFGKYIMFYLRPVAREENIGLIYYIAQRVKQTRDGIASVELDAEEAGKEGAVTRDQASQNLYLLSDLAQAMIRKYEEVMGWSMQAWSGEMGLPKALFARLGSHDEAQRIAVKQHLPKEVLDRVEEIVKVKRKEGAGRKRKSEGAGVNGEEGGEKKRIKSSTGVKKLPIRKGAPSAARKAKAVKTPKAKRTKYGADDDDDGDDADVHSEMDVPSAERRRSGRTQRGGNAKSYKERDDEEDEMEMAELEAQGDAESEAGEEPQTEQEDEMEAEAETNQDSAMDDAAEDTATSPVADQAEHETEDAAGVVSSRSSPLSAPSPEPETKKKVTSKAKARSKVKSPPNSKPAKPAKTNGKTSIATEAAGSRRTSGRTRASRA